MRHFCRFSNTMQKLTEGRDQDIKLPDLLYLPKCVARLGSSMISFVSCSSTSSLGGSEHLLTTNKGDEPSSKEF